METSKSPSRPDGIAQVREQNGFLLFAQGKFAEAVVEFVEVARLRPNVAATHSNLGAALGLLGKFAESFECYERALALDPTHEVAYLNVANLLGKMGRPREAIERFRAAQEKFPESAVVHYGAGRLYCSQGLRVDALSAFARALRVDSNFAQARWMLAIAALPQAYGPQESPASFLEQFENAVDSLDAWFDDERSSLGPRAVGEGQPFYVAFHERNNKPLLTKYGDLCERLMRPLGTAPVPSAVSGRGPVRVAVVSGHLYDQSVWTALVRGWCMHIDPNAVELHLFHTGTTRDAETERARAHGASFQMGLGETPAWIKSIRALEPHAILYPEIGMDTMCAKLASLRLAPTQIVSWGHPETSGLPTIDHFVSGAAFEPPGAESNYRERLVRLPKLGCYYDDLTPEFTGTDWEALGLDPYVPRLMCAGTPYKYMPRDDGLLVEIARRLGKCHFLFFVDPAPHLSQQLQQRLELVFRQAGLDPTDFVKFLPRQSRPAFFGMMRDCDVLLDTVGFSGFNTTMQAIECELPVVAWEGRFMRGRLASGTLRTMGMDELVAVTTEQYVERAVRLCGDATYRLKVADRIALHSGVLFRDLAPIQALEHFLVETLE